MLGPLAGGERGLGLGQVAPHRPAVLASRPWALRIRITAGLSAVAPWVSSAGASAQAPCPDGVCAAGRCERGVCLPEACRDVGACFGASFEDGDCDRDLVPNRSDGTLCEGILITFDVEIGSAPVGAGLRRDPSAGSREVAPGVWSDVPNAVAIGCTAVDRCPVLPGLASRCVFPYPALQGGRLGLCTYGRDTRNDRTCIDAPEVPGTGCLFSGGVPSATGYSDWARAIATATACPTSKIRRSAACSRSSVLRPGRTSRSCVRRGS